MRYLITIPLLLLLAGCADLGYYWHSASGHLDVMDKRVDIEQLLADGELDAKLRERLELVKEIRRFSVERLDLPDNDSYLSYVELDRDYLIKNLFAAPEFSTRLHRWCYPIIGCASYRGYFDEKRLQEYVAELEAQGLEVHVGRVAAYSTLGWFDDPVLSSFVDWPDHRLAGLLFHELTHQQLYIEDDSTFNESLASAVQQVGTELWLQARDHASQIDKNAHYQRYRAEVIELIETTRAELDDLYQRDIEDQQKRELKAETFQRSRQSHAAIAESYGIKRGFTRWFSDELNNAKIGSVSTYNSDKAAFVSMIRAFDLNFAEFYRYAEAVGRLPKDTRDKCLDEWKNGTGAASASCPEIPGLLLTAS